MNVWSKAQRSKMPIHRSLAKTPGISRVVFAAQLHQKVIALHLQLRHLGGTPQRTVNENITGIGIPHTRKSKVSYVYYRQGNNSIGTTKCYLYRRKLCYQEGMFQWIVRWYEVIISVRFTVYIYMVFKRRRRSKRVTRPTKGSFTAITRHG